MVSKADAIEKLPRTLRSSTCLPGHLILPFKAPEVDFPGGAVVKNLPANAQDMGLSPGPGRSHMPRSN